MKITIGTRKSQLALWQAEYVAAQIRRHNPQADVTLHHIVTHGDRVQDKPLPEIGGKGLFTAELESALRDHTIDLAVHSLKDLPTELTPDFTIGAIPPRASPFDVLVSGKGYTLDSLPHGALIGTSSLRRSAQIKARRPDLVILPLRGNVPTRVEKTRNGEYDAVILAAAGLDRLDMQDSITQVLSTRIMLPAPAQGALGIQCRSDDPVIKAVLAPLDDLPTRIAVTAERAFLHALDSGCRLPVAAFAGIDGEVLKLVGRVISLDGQQVIEVGGSASLDRNSIDQAEDLGARLAQSALDQGAGAILSAIEAQIES